MKITPIQRNIIGKQCHINNKKTQQEPSFNGKIKDFFLNYFHEKEIIAVKKEQEEKAFKNFCKTKHRVNKEEYFKIKQNSAYMLCKAQKNVERARSIYGCKVTPAIAAKLALNLKNNFDEKYGENNYRIISLGTSPAIITELMSELGSDIIFLPISQIHNLYKSSIKSGKKFDITNYENTPILVEYLKHKKLNDDKVNIIMDYTVSKITLESVYQLIKKNFDLSKDNLKTCDLIEYLGKIKDNKGKNVFNKTTLDMLKCDLCYSVAELHTNMPHFGIYENINKNNTNWVCGQNRPLEDIFYDFEHCSRELGRSYMLIGLMELDKMKALPKNK